jgi:hypothetical protein
MMVLLLINDSYKQNKKISDNSSNTASETQRQNNILDSPPSLDVRLNGERIITALGSYQWNYKIDENTIQSIAVSGVITDKGENAPIFKAPGKSKLVVNTKTNPDKLKIYSHFGNNDPTQFIDDHTLILPEKKGIYFYSIACDWNGSGSAMYCFNIEIQ